MMPLLFAQVVNGIALGFIYVLIAIGLNIIFGLLGIVFFAHGAMFALGAYLGFTLQAHFGWPAVIFAPIAVFFIGIVIDRVLLRPISKEEPAVSLIVTFALALFVEAILRSIWGAQGFPMPAPVTGVFIWGPIFVTNYRLLVTAMAIVCLVALYCFLRFTPYGRILRAGSRDPEMVELLGINMPLALTGAFAVGTALAGMAGVLAAPMWSVNPGMGELAIMPAFVIVTIGGLGSYLGSVVSGLSVGILTSLTVQFWPEGSIVAMYVLMIVVLLIRPRGIFGERWEKFE